MPRFELLTYFEGNNMNETEARRLVAGVLAAIKPVYGLIVWVAFPLVAAAIEHVASSVRWRDNQA